MLDIQNIMPIPLKETASNPNTQIWNQNFRLDKGKNYLIKAASGKGKSTFLHILYGLRQDFEGQVLWEGKNSAALKENDWSKLRQERFAIVFQNLRLFQQLSALENILINLHAPASTEQMSQIQAMATKLSIANLLEQSCGTLSYGQQQRVAIIRALMQPFDFLFLDEPFSHLDKANIAAAVQLINERCAEQGAGWVLVSLGDDYGLKSDAILEL